MIRPSHCLVALSVVAARAPRAFAEGSTPKKPERPADAFGAAGEVVPSLGASFQRYQYSSSKAQGLNVGFWPGVDYFLLDNVSVGANASLGYDSDTRATGDVVKSFWYGASTRFGVSLPLTGHFSIWSLAAFGAWQEHASIRSPYEGSEAYFGGVVFDTTGTTIEVRRTVLWVELFVPILFHPVEHLFIGVGPNVSQEVLDTVESMSSRSTSWGFGSVIGGWF
jgi:hypothetical protein